MKYTHENTGKIGMPMRAFLDGVEVKGVAECDTDKGYIMAHEVDEEGRIISGFATIRYGVVTVEPMDA